MIVEDCPDVSVTLPGSGEGMSMLDNINDQNNFSYGKIPTKKKTQQG